VFFELNGQPREVTVVDRSLDVEEAARPKASPGDPKQVAAPMPGMVVTVAVQAADPVTKGQKLLTMEAMKMETTLYAEQDGKVAKLYVQPGTQVDTGDLVIQLE
jgi:pyruvate carboxylase